MDLFTIIWNSHLIMASIPLMTMEPTGVSGNVSGNALGNVSLHSPMMPTSTIMQKRAKCQESENTKWAYNLWIKDLKKQFNSEVDSIAQEFSWQGVHHSVCQIRKQVLFSMSQPVKEHKPSTYNAWAHAEVLAEQLGGMFWFGSDWIGFWANIFGQGMTSHCSRTLKNSLAFWRIWKREKSHMRTWKGWHQSRNTIRVSYSKVLWSSVSRKTKKGTLLPLNLAFIICQSMHKVS